MHLTKLLLILLFFILPLVHGNLLPTLGIPFSLSVSGNFEFTKVMFFNILSGLIFLSFFGESMIARYILSQSQLHRCSQDSSQSQLPLLASQVIPLYEGDLGSSINLPHGGRWLSVSEDGGSCNGVKSGEYKGDVLRLAPFSPWGKGWDRGITWRTFGIGGFFILLLSTLFSTSPFITLIGDTEKGHTALMYLNLIGLYLVLKNLEKVFLQKLILTSLLSGVCISLLALKEFFFPSFDYGDLSNRALGTFGHPNYLAGYLLLVLPFVLCHKCSLFPLGLRERIQVWVMFSLILLTLILTKSIVALFLAVGYIIYTLRLAPFSPWGKDWDRGNRKIRLGGGFVGGALFFLSLTFLIQYFPEKLHSFLSRFYLWETTLKIIFSDIKIFLIGAGAETLPYFFDSFKVPEVYIYENFGYTADRAHNFLLDIFFQFGIFGVLLFLYCIFRLYRKVAPLSYEGEGFGVREAKISLFLFLLFGIFHYFSIASYIVLVLILNISQLDTSLNSLSKPHHNSSPQGEDEITETSVTCSLSLRRGLGGGFWGVGLGGGIAWKGFRYGIGIFLLILTLLPFTGAYFSLQLYRAELAFASGNTKQAQEIFSHPKYLIELGKYEEAEKREGLLSQNNLKEQILTDAERVQNCEILTIKFPSAENHFYCGNIFWKLGKEDIAKNYYRQGLTKLPDLWESDSAYWQQYFVHKSITGHRFFSEKFSDISEILQKLEIPIESKK